MSEQGSATIVMTAVVGILGVCLVATTSLAGLFAARATATLAADASALAAAVATYPGTGRGPPTVEATRAAAANGASLDVCQCPVDSGLGPRVVAVRTLVEVDVPLFGRLRVGAWARAEFDPGVWLGR